MEDKKIEFSLTSVYFFTYKTYTKKILRAMFKWNLLIFLVSSVRMLGQEYIPEPGPKTVRAIAVIEGSDTIPVFFLDEVEVVSNFIFASPRQYERWTAIKYHVKTVYPYAIIASVKLKEYDRVLTAINDERLKRKYLNLCEKELRTQFEGQLRNLTITQGRILMKLIHRECGKTTYQIVKELRGNFEAAMWQALARLFGNNMKAEYDPYEEDLMIEKAVALVEKGYF